MTEPFDSIRPPRSFWLVALGSLLWNLIGVMNFVYTVTLSPETLAAMPEAERILYTDIPFFVNACFALAVFSGTLASVLLLMRRAICVSAFLVSLAAIVLQVGFGLWLTPMLEAQGAAALALPALITLFAGVFLWYSRRMAALGVLR
ncbi:MAG: hypothetical protein KDK05_26210 [Candidatus Competibacteraceae bacterium]|nr:hypothetical protein [Pseudomonadales bacterium]MCB1718644.1 hypothetical protein [Candidatus Competibacteraceae bacterium]MCP5357874.1 hypothetical protein [Pseudomonadales bacterium]